jgi:WD40 repeat protein
MLSFFSATMYLFQITSPYLAGGCSDGTIKIWEVVRRLTPIVDIISLKNNRQASINQFNKTINVWDVRKDKLLESIDATSQNALFNSNPVCLEWLDSNNFASGLDDEIKIWQI